jgi:hypothetical protein
VGVGVTDDPGELVPGKDKEEQDQRNEKKQRARERKVGLIRRLIGGIDQQGNDKKDEVPEHGISCFGGMASAGFHTCAAAGRGVLFLDWR